LLHTAHTQNRVPAHGPVHERALDVLRVVLVLERTEDGVTDSVEFYVSDDELRIRENGVEAGALTSQKVSVSNLVFRAVVGGLTEGVKVDLSLTATSGTSTKTESFNAFAVTRKP